MTPARLRLAVAWARSEATDSTVCSHLNAALRALTTEACPDDQMPTLRPRSRLHQPGRPSSYTGQALCLRCGVNYPRGGAKDESPLAPEQ